MPSIFGHLLGLGYAQATNRLLRFDREEQVLAAWVHAGECRFPDQMDGGFPDFFAKRPNRLYRREQLLVDCMRVGLAVVKALFASVISFPF